MEDIRLMLPEDIDVRVGQTYERNGKVFVNVLLYKNARVDMKILDELFTPFGWKREHKLIGDRLYCQVSVLNPETHEWITKEDVGTESNTEAEKGQASDSFKRACVNWGIGRELYTAPKDTYIELTTEEWKKDQQNGRIRVNARFFVSEIDYDKKNRIITSLVIVDKDGNPRYVFRDGKRVYLARPQGQASAPSAPVAPAQPPVLSKTAYAKMVKNEATGVMTQDGKTHRQAWIDMYHPTAEEIEQFDIAVENMKFLNKNK